VYYVDATEVNNLSEALIQPFLHSHQNREVKALVACCIADVFRVSYPDPPYDENERKVREQGRKQQMDA